MKNNEGWDIIIEPKTKSLNFNFAEVWAYRDLILMFIKRDFIALYKQTILGPIWFVIQPLITTLTYVVVFGEIANLKTDNQPKVLFYLSGIIFWNFFSAILLKTSETFTANAGIFGKVYFPRLVVPISIVCTSFVSFAIQFILFVCIYIYYVFFTNYNTSIHVSLILIPFLIIMMSCLALGLGILISSLTTKYRDLKFVVSFGMQLLMYAAPIVYPLSMVTNERIAFLLKINPLTSFIESFRYTLFNSNSFSVEGLLYASVVTVFILLMGVVVFNKVEKTFMDTI